ncbi:MAG: hypothetical protein ABIE68_04010 [bacterium]
MPNNYINILKKIWPYLALFITTLTVLTFIFSAVQTPEYKSEVTMLVIQEQEGSMDAYTATRSAETIASLLTNMVHTSSFFERVMDSKYDIANTYSSDPIERQKQWDETIDANLSDKSGIMKLAVYNPDPNQSEKIARAVASVLTYEGDIYHGGGDAVTIKMVNVPTTSENPVKPAIATNTFSALLLGIIFSVVIIIAIGFRKDIDAVTVKVNDEGKEEILESNDQVNEDYEGRADDSPEPGNTEFEEENYFNENNDSQDESLDKLKIQETENSQPETLKQTPNPEDYFNNLR